MVKFKFPGKPSKIGHRNLVKAYNVIPHSNGFINTENNPPNNSIQNRTTKEKQDEHKNMTVMKCDESNAENISISKKVKSRDSAGRVIIREARLNISSQTMGQESVSLDENDKDARNFRTGSKPLSGYITCGICRGVRYYKYILQTKKYGIYSCEPCRKFILRMLALTKTPSTKYIRCKSPSTPGKCVIPTTIVNPNWKWNKSTYFTNRRCEVCWLILCLQRYRMPLEQKKLLAKLISDDIRPRDLTTYNSTITEPIYCNRPGLSGVTERTNNVMSRYTSTRCRLKNRLNRTKTQCIIRKAFSKTQKDTKRRERLREKFNSRDNGSSSLNMMKELDKEEPEFVQKGPRIKHVCRSASSVLKATQIVELPIENQVEVETGAIFDTTTISKRNVEEDNKVEEKTRRISRSRQSIECENVDESCQTDRPSYGARSLQDFEKESKNDSEQEEEEEDKLICTDYWENDDKGVIKRYGFALIMSEAIGIPPVCFICGSGGLEKLLHCICCCEPYHWYCVKEGEDVLWKSNWICPKCKWCMDVCDICSKSNRGKDEGNKLYCGLCLNLYHKNCITDSSHNIITNTWICKNCKKYYKNSDYRETELYFPITNGSRFNKTPIYRDDYMFLQKLMTKEERKSKTSIDIRRCVLCKCAGERSSSTEQGRLLYCGQNEWIHVNCAVWSSNVYELRRGYLNNVHITVNKARHVRCALCNQKGASLGCCFKNCINVYHFQCARKSLCLFTKGMKVYCSFHNHHNNDLMITIDDINNDFKVLRPIYVEIEEKKKKFAPNTDVRLKIGSLDIENLGKIDPQLSNNQKSIIPVNFRCTRLYWSTIEPWKIVRYVLEIKVKYKKMDDTDNNYTVDHTESNNNGSMTSLATTMDDVIPADLKDVIFKDLHDLDDGAIRDIWMNYDDSIEKMKKEKRKMEKREKRKKMEKQEKYREMKKRKMSFYPETKKRIDYYEISQLDGVCDGYIMESDDEAQFVEQPVRCTKCDRTYRTNISYEKHLETCTIHFGDCESEEERQQQHQQQQHTWQAEIQPQPDLFITGFNDNNRSTIQFVINNEEAKRQTMDYYAFQTPQQPVLQLQPVTEQSYVIQEPVSYIRPELILTPQLQLQPVIMQPTIIEPTTYIMNTAPLMLQPQQPVYIDGGLGGMIHNNTFMSQFVSHSMTDGLNYSATTTQLLQTTNPGSHTTGYIIINEQQNHEPVKRKPVRTRAKKQTRNNGPVINNGPVFNNQETVFQNNGPVLLPVSTAAPCITFGEPTSCFTFAEPTPCISYAEPAPCISYAEPAPCISFATNTQPPLIEFPSLQATYPFASNIPKPFPQPEYKLYASVGTSTSDLPEIPTPNLSPFPSTPIISLPPGSIIPTVDFQSYHNPIFQPMTSQVPSIVTPNTDFQVSVTPSITNEPAKLTTTPIVSSSVKSPTVTPIVSSPLVVPPPLETPLLVLKSDAPPVITPKPLVSLHSFSSSASELCISKPFSDSLSTVDFSQILSYDPPPPILSTSHSSSLPPISTPRVSTPSLPPILPNIPSPRVSASSMPPILPNITSPRVSASSLPPILPNIPTPKVSASSLPPILPNIQSIPTPKVSIPCPIATPSIISPYVPPTCKSFKKSSLPISMSPPPVRKSSSIPSLSSWKTATISYEVTAEDGFSYTSNSLKDVWNKVFENVQKGRLSKKLPLLPKNSLTTTTDEDDSANRILGLHHNATKYILEQLPDAFKLSLYQPSYHKLSFLSGNAVTNESGCARTEPFSSQHKYDMFGWLASRHRRPPKFLSITDSSIINGNRRVPSLNLPIAMRFRHLRETAKKTVGVFRSDIQGRGLFCLKDVDIGEMVIEYAGEVIRSSLTDKREKYYTSKGIGCYMFRVDDKFVVDATMAGNAARFINHSCEPNCYSKIVEVLGMKHILIFALRKIKKGEELTYDYKFPLEEEKLSCHCLSKKCRKYLN